MSMELFITTVAVISLAVLRFGLPLMLMWLLGKALRYAQVVLP